MFENACIAVIPDKFGGIEIEILVKVFHVSIESLRGGYLPPLYVVVTAVQIVIMAIEGAIEIEILRKT